MEIKIISLKLLIYSVIVAFAVLSFNLFMHHSSILTLCNEQGDMDVYIRYLGQDIIINPRSLKNITYCLGKSMPFYDRTIEYIISPGSGVEKGIRERYKVVNVLNKENIQLRQYKIAIDSKKITLSKNSKFVFIFKRQITSLSNFFVGRPYSILSVIRPRSSDSIEGLLNKIPLAQQVIPNGEFSTQDFTRLHH